jgi:hypothetical protein
LYDWFGKSNHGLLVFREEGVTIDYLQAGPQHDVHLVESGARTVDE